MGRRIARPTLLFQLELEIARLDTRGAIFLAKEEAGARGARNLRTQNEHLKSVL